MADIFIGIDPGKKGCMSIITPYPDETVISKFPFENNGIEDYRMVLSLLVKDNVRVMVEHVQGMPWDTPKTAFALGYNYGQIISVLEQYKLPYQEVKPSNWKKEFNLINKDKQASIDVCKKLFPDVSLKRTDKCSKDHDGIAESLLMAEWARRHMK